MPWGNALDDLGAKIQAMDVHIQELLKEQRRSALAAEKGLVTQNEQATALTRIADNMENIVLQVVASKTGVVLPEMIPMETHRKFVNLYLKVGLMIVIGILGVFGILPYVKASA